MRELFKLWRRKAGCVALVMACVLMAVWIGLRSQFGDKLEIINRSSIAIDLVKIAVVRSERQTVAVHPIGDGDVIVGETRIGPGGQVSKRIQLQGRDEFYLYITTSKGTYYSAELVPLPWGNRIRLNFVDNRANSIQCNGSILRRFVNKYLRAPSRDQ